MRGITCGMVAAACVVSAGCIGLVGAEPSSPAARILAEASASIQKIPRQWTGWFHWRCWDEAQRVTLELSAPAIASDGKLVMSGRERYDVDGRWHAVAVRVTIDAHVSLFTLEETEAARDVGAEAPSPGPFFGNLSPDGRRVRPPRDAARGCEPELMLDTATEPTGDEPSQAVTESAVEGSISLVARHVE